MRVNDRINDLAIEYGDQEASRITQAASAWANKFGADLRTLPLGDDLFGAVEHLDILFSPRQGIYISPRSLERSSDPAGILAQIREERECNRENIDYVSPRILALPNLSAPVNPRASLDDLIAIEDDEAFVASIARAFDCDPGDRRIVELRNELSEGAISREQLVAELWHAEGPLKPHLSAAEAHARPVGHKALPNREAQTAVLAAVEAASGGLVLGNGIALDGSLKGKTITRHDPGYVLAGPKCYLAAGTYKLKVQMQVKSGLFLLDIVGFGGLIKFFDQKFIGNLGCEFVITFAAPVDLCEIRLEALGRSGNEVDVALLALEPMSL